MLLYQLDEIDEVKLQQACDNRTPESQTLEFKRELPKVGKDNEEFLKDISSMANANGGDVIYGIEENAGAALRIHPIEVTSIDSEKRRLGQILDGMEPRITGIQFKEVLVTGGHVLILRVPQSYDSPHWVTYKDAEKFFLRSGTHTSKMSYDQLKTAFDRTATLADRAKVFRQQRLSSIFSGGTAKTISLGPIGIVHVIPLASLIGRQNIDVIKLNRNIAEILFADWHQSYVAMNLDGIITYCSTHGEGPETDNYNQIYRIGCTETVFFAGGHVKATEKFIPSTVVTTKFRTAIRRNLQLLINSGLAGPAIIGVSMHDVGVYRFGVGSVYHMLNNTIPDRNSLVLSEVWVEGMGQLQDSDEIIRPIMDIIWQSFGVERCFEYTEDGKWNPRSN